MMRRAVLTILPLILAGQVSAQPVCTTGSLFSGAPRYEEPMDRAKDGQHLKDVPPLNWRTMVITDGRLVTSVGQEIWFTELSAADPVLKRLAGKEDSKLRSSIGGVCSAARFTSATGLAVLPDGSLIGSDHDGNNLFVVQDPFGACNVAMIAGATAPQQTVVPNRPANVGDRDGPGARALFSLPDWVATISDTAYFIDRNDGNGKLKKIGSDAAHTVTTVATLPPAIYYALVALNAKLYAIGNNDTAEGLLVEVDPATGAVREVVRGRSDTWLGRGAINVSGLATDGTGLFTTSAGKLLYVTTGGEISHIAGSGVWFEFETGYNHDDPHSAMDLQLVANRQVQTAGSNVFLAYADGNVYFAAKDETTYVMKIECK